MTAGASLILTFNTSDFPVEPDYPKQPVAVHPDNFLRLICIAAPETAVASVQAIIARTRLGKDGEADFVAALERAELTQTARLIAKLLTSGT